MLINQQKEKIMPIDNYIEHKMFMDTYHIRSAFCGGLYGGPTRRKIQKYKPVISVTYDKGKDNDATLRVKLKQAYAKKEQKGIPVDVRMKEFNKDLKHLKTHGSVMVAI